MPTLQHAALQSADGTRTQAWREAGLPHLPALVLLHGIGSASGSWAGALHGLSSRFRVIAWDAPGYGGSGALVNAQPLAVDCAQALEALLGHLQVEAATLVGHSLGALIAAAAAARGNFKVDALVLASPAQGYGQVAPELRAKKYLERLTALDQLGIEGMAAARSAALCAPQASAPTLQAVQDQMRQTTPGGYRQAAYMLAHDDLRQHLRQHLRDHMQAHPASAVAVICGELDGVTPPRGARALAAEFQLPYREVPGVAHALYVEDPERFNTVLLSLLYDLNDTGAAALIPLPQTPAAPST